MAMPSGQKDLLPFSSLWGILRGDLCQGMTSVVPKSLLNKGL
jgi:hypothetical protein